jgi:hypothetical protein
MHEKHTYCKEKAPCKLELIKIDQDTRNKRHAGAYKQRTISC